MNRRIVYWSTPSFADCDFPLIKALRQEGHEVLYLMRLAPFMCKTTLIDIDRMDARNVVIPASSYPQLAAWGEYIDLDNSYVSNDTVGKTGIRSFRLFLEEWRLIRSFRPDVVHHVGIPLVFHLFLLWKYRKKSVCVIHDPLPHSGESKLRNKLKLGVLGRYMKKFVLLNDKQTSTFCKAWHIASVHVYTASLGVYECYKRYLTGNRIGGSPYILFFGRISPYKGIEYAVEAFMNCHREHPDIRFIIAGAGEQYFSLPEKEDSIVFIHRYLTVHEIADYVSQALFVVCPYTDATQSGVILTSLSLGTPVVATRVGNFDQVLTHGENGWLVDPGDSMALTAAFQFLLDRPEMIGQMRDRILARNADDVHSWRRIARRYLEIYNL